MNKNPLSRLLIAAALSLSISAPAVAGPYADSLTKCLVQSTTTADKTTLVQWIFAMMTLHPQVSSMSSLTQERRTQANKEAARLFQQLLTKTCLNETRQAARYEGHGVIEQSFNQLGQIAARELFSDPAVTGGMMEFGSFIDKNAVEQVLGPANR